jgi:type I restriction enzyme S subunit
VIADLKPYPAYKDSGVPWLGEVPEHWEMRRLKWAATLNPSKTEARSTLTADTPVTFLPMERVGADGRVDAHEVRPASDVWNGFTYFRRDDILVAKITPCFENGKGACLDVLPTGVGFGSTEFHVLRAASSISPQFLYRLTIIPEFRKLGADAMTGAAGQQRVSQSFVGNFPITLPPLPEQTAIVRLLDHADRRIRRYIRAKQKLIALLNEQKQAIIHRAVTRGLDPNVRLKPSGVEWLGKVPEHWEVKRLKALVTESVAGPYGSSLTKSMYTSAGYRVYGQQQVIPDNFCIGDYYISEEKYQGMRRYRVFPDDVLVSVMGTVGRVAVVPESAEPGIINPRLVRYRPNLAKVRPRYLQLTMLSPTAHTQLSEGAKGTTMEGLNMQILGRLLLAIPSVDEQDAILAAVAAETTQFQKAIDAASRSVSLLREYRTRLIADVVTGKLDVREAAARLSDEEKSEELEGAEGLAEEEEGESPSEEAPADE